MEMVVWTQYVKLLNAHITTLMGPASAQTSHYILQSWY